MECPKFRSKAAPDISLEPERRVDGQGNDYLLTKFGFAVCHISLCPRCSYCTVHSSTNISLHKRVGNIIKYRWDLLVLPQLKQLQAESTCPQFVPLLDVQTALLSSSSGWDSICHFQLQGSIVALGDFLSGFVDWFERHFSLQREWYQRMPMWQLINHPKHSKSSWDAPNNTGNRKHTHPFPLFYLSLACLIHNHHNHTENILCINPTVLVQQNLAKMF